MALRNLDIQSSAFNYVAWDDETYDLTIVFAGARGAPRYVYPGIGPDLIKDWSKAHSRGGYFHKHIKKLSARKS